MVILTEEPQRAVLDAADALFYERGIAAVGMADVRDAAHVSLRRLYGLYDSKRALVAAWLDDRHERWMNWFAVATERHVASGTDPVLAAFDALGEWVSAAGYNGCAFIRAVAETTEIDDAHRSIVAEHKHSIITYVGLLASSSLADVPAWLPEALAVLIDGAIVQSAIFGTATPVAAARRAAASIMETVQ